MAEALEDPTTAMQCLQTYLIVRSHDISALATLRSTERLLALAATYEWEEGEELALFDHAVVHFDLGNLDVVRADYRKVIALSQARGNGQFVAFARTNLGSIESSESHFEQAIVQFKAAIPFLTDNPVVHISTLSALAHVQIELDRFAAAEETLRTAEAIPNAPAAQQALLLAGRSLLDRRLGHPEAAAEAAREGLRRLGTSSGGGPSPDQSTLLGELARAYRASGRRDEAIVELRKALASIENAPEDAGADPLARASVLTAYNNLCVDLVELLAERNDVDEAFRLTERMRGRGLREALVASHIDLSASLSAEERAREQRLVARVVELNKALLAARQAVAPVAQLERELEDARIEVNAFQSELRLKHPSVVRRRSDADASLTLPAHSESLALIEYVVAPEQVIAFVVTNGSPVRAVRLPVTRKMVERDARELELLIGARSPGYQAVARRMHASLFAPLERHLRGKRTLAVIPDGALWNVPFQALIAGNGRHLIDRYTLFYAHSLALLRNASALDVAVPARLLALGNPTVAGETRTEVRTAFRSLPLVPLADAETEVHSLAAFYPAAQRRVLLRDAASETLFKNEAPAFNVIHVAAHAIVDDRAPMYSAIVLSSKSTDEDGLLEAREVADLPLNAGLAVLSACRTARGTIRSGEGVIGLNWAFFAAGCPTTVVSQWDAESKATATLMVELHRHLRAGDTTAAALRAAQRLLRMQPRYRHPFYWASFIAVGAANRALR
jgi:CHAT domain-containing protein